MSWGFFLENITKSRKSSRSIVKAITNSSIFVPSFVLYEEWKPIIFNSAKSVISVDFSVKKLFLNATSKRIQKGKINVCKMRICFGTMTHGNIKIIYNCIFYSGNRDTILLLLQSSFSPKKYMYHKFFWRFFF